MCLLQLNLKSRVFMTEPVQETEFGERFQQSQIPYINSDEAILSEKIDSL